MLPINITSLLGGTSAVEWARIEFKEGWNPLDVIHTLCAFANDFNNLDGGYVIIGIAEKDGKPVFPPKGLSQSEIDKIQKELIQYGHDKIRPSYHPLAFPCQFQNKNILVLRSPGGQNRPYQAATSFDLKKLTWSYYIRKLSSTVKARGNDLNELLSLAQKIPFDDRFNQQASINDLELPLIQAFLNEIGSELASQAIQLDFETLCRQMSIVGGSPEYPLPQNVGLMFFSSRPDKYFPHSQIDVVKFPSGTGGNTIIEKSFFGPLNQQIRDALHYIDTTTIEEFILKQPTKAEAERFFNYPYQAIEEILVNAVYHRSYELREPTEVRILPDRITIISYSGPDRSIRLDALAAGNFVARRYRNRRIGEFLKELRLTEGRGTGIPKAIRAMTENGSPQPIFETDEDRSFFAATLPIHPKFSTKKGVTSGVTTPELTPELTPDVEKFLNDKAVDLLEFCATPRSRTEISMHLQLTDAKHIRERYIFPLLSAKLLVMTDPEHPNSPKQKYKTTKLGIKAVELNVKPNMKNPGLFDYLK
jgi:ATP-dependent DNA helicase RecG